MTLRLDPRIPFVWRTPQSAQFGIDSPVVVLNEVSLADELMLAALKRGVTRPGLALIGSSASANDEDVDTLLAKVAPALVDNSAAAKTRPVRIAYDGSGRATATLRQAFSDVGYIDVSSSPHSAHPDIAVIVAEYAVAPHRHEHWLRRDVPHAPLVISDLGASFGPIVSPGDGPCLHCVDYHRVDRDPAWPAIATQLVGMDAPRHEPSVIFEIVAHAVRAVQERLRPGSHSDRFSSAYIDAASGAVSVLEHHPHADCGCRALQGTVTATDHPATRQPQTS